MDPAPTPNNLEDITGQSIGDFHIIRRLGQGGMGQVYLAEQTALKRKVALKFLKPEVAAKPLFVTRFRAEAEAVARINHPNIVQVYTVGAADGRHFMALEYVEGMNLRDYVTRKGPLDLSRGLMVMRKVAAALQQAGEAGIVHRDIKPENILLTRKGEVKVADFGLSRVFGNEDVNLTSTGMTMGTPLYMSPEQVQGKTVDPRSDIYSFGVTCYHMFSGRPPFLGQTAIEVAMKQVNDLAAPLQSARPDLPPELCALVHRMMAKKPDARPQTGREILKEIAVLRDQAPENPFADLPAAAPAKSGFPTNGNTQPSAQTAAVDLRPAWWKLIAAGLLAVAIGGVTRVAIAPPRHSPAQNAMPDPDIAEDEHFLLDMVRRYSSASLSNPDAIKRAFLVHVQLGVLYLDQRRFSEVDTFLNQLSEKDPALQFLRNLFQGIRYAMLDEPDKALASLQLAFGDPIYSKYLAFINNPPSREGVDLRSLTIEALDRIEKSQRLPPPLARVRTEWQNYLRRPLGPPVGKKGT